MARTKKQSFVSQHIGVLVIGVILVAIIIFALVRTNTVAKSPSLSLVEENELGAQLTGPVDRFPVNTAILESTTTLPQGCTSPNGHSWTTGLPCWIITRATNGINMTSVTINGAIFDAFPSGTPPFPGAWGTVNVGFEYRVQGSNTILTTPIQQMTSGSYFTKTISGLLPNTTYQYRACTWDSQFSGNTCANIRTFKTYAGY